MHGRLIIIRNLLKPNSSPSAKHHIHDPTHQDGRPRPPPPRALRQHPAAIVPVRRVADPGAAAHIGRAGRQGARAREAGGLQLGAGVRRQQGAQAGVPGGGGAVVRRRHAGVHRRRAVEPHARGGRGGRGAGAAVRAGPGEVGGPGRLGRRRRRSRGEAVPRRRQHPAVAADERRRAARARHQLRHRAQADAGRAAARAGRPGAQAILHPGGGQRPPARGAGVCALGAGGRGAGAADGRLLRHGDRVRGDGVHVRGHGGRVQAGAEEARLPEAAGHRHRRVRDGEADLRPGAADREDDGREDRAGGERYHGGGHRARRQVSRRRVREAGRADVRRDPVRCDDGGVYYGPRVRGQEFSWHDGHDSEGRNKGGKQCAVRASGRAIGFECLSVYRNVARASMGLINFSFHPACFII